MPSFNRDRLTPKQWSNQRGREPRNRHDEDEGSSASSSITLTELCEPFFVEVCGVIRSTERGGEREAWQVRDRLKKKMDALMEQAKNDYAWLAEDYCRIEPVLAYFADVVIADSKLPYAAQWTGQMLLANEPRINIKNGRQQFFDELTATLREPGSRAAQRLAVFQTCLGLGFGGIYRENPAKLRQISDEILQHLERDSAANRGRGDRRNNHICDEAYRHTQDDVIFKPVAEKIWAISIACAALLLATLITYVAIHLMTRNEIESVLGDIIKSSK